MDTKMEKKEELSGIILNSIVQDKVKSLDMKSCKILIEIITVLKAMKLRSIVDLETIIAKERPEVIQGLAEIKGFGSEQQPKKI